MRRFLFHSILFASLFFGVSALIHMAKPFYFENAMFREKINEIPTECPSCNTFFIGSSLTFRHVNPMLFDSLVNSSSGHPISESYNLGSVQVNFLESMYLAEHSMEEKIVPAKSTLFLELRPHTIKDSIFTAKNTFYRDIHDLDLVASHHQNLFDKARVIYSSNAQYLFKYINGGILSTLNKNYVIEQLKQYGIRGFLPYTVSSKSRNKKISIAYDDIDEYNPEHTSIVVKQLKHIQEIAKKHQIRLIYLVPNLFLDESSDWKTHLIHPLQKDSSLQIIDMGQPHRYPRIFSPYQYHDKVHLHEDGANLYTQLLVDAYLEL
ncbi:MAG: hypothetical protein CMN34_02390 [Saprospirales bacterium]|nr:hypothetical protein [Saprospirales bacterium]